MRFGFAVAGIHADFLLRQPGNGFHRHALQIALIVEALPAVVQPLSGDLIHQVCCAIPACEIAAFEAIFIPSGARPSILEAFQIWTQEVFYAIDIPYGLSLLLYLNPTAQGIGLRSQGPIGPPSPLCMLPFSSWWSRSGHDGIGALGRLVLVAKAAAGKGHALLRALALTAPLGFLAINPVGSSPSGPEPWIIYGVMRTSEAVTPMPGLWVPMVTFTVLYGI